jgi:hypothetical protein
MTKVIRKGGKKLTFELLPGGNVKRNGNRRSGSTSWKQHRVEHCADWDARRPIGVKSQPNRVQVPPATALVAATCVAHTDNVVICLRDEAGQRETVRIPRNKAA